MTDRISYLPRRILEGNLRYNAAFKNLHTGLETHVYAPLSVDIRETWAIRSNTSKEEEEGGGGANKPTTRLCLLEEGWLNCHRLIRPFVSKNLDIAHKVLVERMVMKAELIHTAMNQPSLACVVPRHTSIIGSYMESLQRSKTPISTSSRTLTPPRVQPSLGVVGLVYRDARDISYLAQSKSATCSHQECPMTRTTEPSVAELPASASPSSPLFNDSRYDTVHTV
jgi:hypothetical protein